MLGAALSSRKLTYDLCSNYPVSTIHLEGCGIKRTRSIAKTEALKGLGHVNINKPVISIMHNFLHTCLLCCANFFVDGLNLHYM